MGNYIGEAGWLESRWWNDKWLECQSLYLSIYLSIYCICLSICPSVRLSDLSIDLSIFLSIYRIDRSSDLSDVLFFCVCLSICLLIHPSTYLSIFLSFYLSVHPSVTLDLSVYPFFFPCIGSAICLLSFCLICLFYRWKLKRKLFCETFSEFEGCKLESEAFVPDFLQSWKSCKLESKAFLRDFGERWYMKENLVLTVPIRFAVFGLRVFKLLPEHAFFFLHFNFQTIQTRNILTHFLECWTSKSGPSSEHSCFLALVASKSVKHESFGHF